MCGIVGFISHQGVPDTTRLEKALEQLKHRGPDDMGLHLVNNVGLGHTRLSIIDLQGGKQPLRSYNGNLHLVANGEIYNYPEIAKCYSQLSNQANSHSDSEAILQVYQANAETGFQQLNGMYAFALYDQQEEKLILCRDRLGIKPLFYVQTAKGIGFASEIKALLPLLESTPEINPQALAQFLQNQFHTGRDTIFKGIQRVLPGEFITIKKGLISAAQYWDITEIKTNTLQLEEAIDAFESLFAQVMTEHIRSDVPYGLFLSGGIDSSILLGQLSTMQDRPLKTYSIGFTGTKMQDELSAATALAQSFCTEHTPVEVSRENLFGRIVHSIWAADDLMRDYASLPTLALSEVAARDVKVVFSGEAGDEAFAGYRRYAPSLARWINYRLFGGGLRAQGQWHQSVTDTVFTDQLKSCDHHTTFTDLWEQAPNDWTLMQKRQFVDVKAALVDNLFVKTDRMMMAFGLEGRVPFADHRVVEFGFALQDRLKYQQKKGKWILRKWAEQFLPLEHLRKPKRGFYVPVKEWLSGEFANQLGQKLVTNVAINEYFQIDGVKRTIAEHISGKNYSREIWGLMQFAIWHKLFVEDVTNAPKKHENPLDWI